MDYRTYLKTMMMRGKVYKSKGQGFVSINDADIPKMQLQNYSGGTISHRAVVDRVVDSLNNLNIGGGLPSDIRKKLQVANRSAYSVAVAKINEDDKKKALMKRINNDPVSAANIANMRARVSGLGARKKDYGIDALPTSKPKKTKGSGNNFKSLKFNF